MLNQDCADCYYMDTCPNNEGKFRCNNTQKSGYEYVSANKEKCTSFAAALYGKRKNEERDKLRNVSKRHGYYVITAICDILGIPKNSIYMTSFVYIHDEYLPLYKDVSGYEHYKTFLDEYEVFGPIYAERLKEEDDGDILAAYFVGFFLQPFAEHVQAKQYDLACDTIIKMFSVLKERYRYVDKEQKNKKELSLMFN